MASSCRSWCTCTDRISNCPEASLAVGFTRLMNLARTICLSGARCSTCPPISWVCCANSHRLQIFQNLFQPILQSVLPHPRPSKSKHQSSAAFHTTRFPYPTTTTTLTARIARGASGSD
jgi:adenine-specific DNA glycosylase